MPDPLPFAAGGEPAAPRPAATVLIVTADEALGARLEAALARVPRLTCLTARSVPAALERLSRGGLELMLIDLARSDASGQGPFERQGNAEPPVPFVALIGPGEERLGLELMREGALDCLVKGARLLEGLPSALEGALQRLARQRQLAAELGAGQAAGLLKRQRAEEALRRSEERLRFAAQEAGFGIYELDLVTGQAYRSPEYKALFGLGPDDEFRLDADQVPLYVHPADRALLRNVTRESRDPRGPGAKDVEYRVLLPGGAVRWLLVRGRTSFEGEGAARRPVRSRGIALDITGRKHLEQEILEISGREQRRIGHDLHDDLCQRLGGLQLLSGVLEKDLAAEGSARAAQAGQILAQAQEALERARRLARGLAPVGLEEGGLVTAFEGLAVSAAELFGIECPFRAEAPVAVADAGAATHVYRIAQEALTNAVRHGQATRVSLGLRQAGDGYELTVSDNGRGFSPTAAACGMGLRIMKYRAGVIGATLEVRSEVGQGATVTCAFGKGLCSAKGPKRPRVQTKRSERKPTEASPAQ